MHLTTTLIFTATITIISCNIITSFHFSSWKTNPHHGYHARICHRSTFYISPLFSKDENEDIVRLFDDDDDDDDTNTNESDSKLQQNFCVHKEESSKSSTATISSITAAVPTVALPIVISILLATSTILLSSQLNDLLNNYEWFQAYRYAWPLVGCIYVWDGLLHFFQKSSSSSSNNRNGVNSFLLYDDDDGGGLQLFTGRPDWLRGFLILAGTGLIVGGAADAILPVYVTGPNFVTAAGLGPDAAAFLFVMSAVAYLQNVVGDEDDDDRRSSRGDDDGRLYYDNDDDDSRLDPWWRRVGRGVVKEVGGGSFPLIAVLLAQLYVLGEGTFDDIISRF